MTRDTPEQHPAAEAPDAARAAETRAAEHPAAATAAAAPVETPAQAVPVLRLTVVSGGLSTPSRTQDLADTIAERTAASLASQGVRAHITSIGVRELLVGIAHKLTTGVTEPDLRFALDALRESDGVVAVSPVFNGQLAGHFKAFFDLVEPGSLRGIPVALGATGGTPRHALVLEMNLRPLFAYLRAFPLPTGVFGASQDSAEDTLSRAALAGRELAEAMLLLRTPSRAHDPARAAEEATSLLATAYDYSEEGIRERDRREQHENFARLLTQYAQESWPEGVDPQSKCGKTRAEL